MEATESSTCHTHFARAIIGREGYHLDPVPEFGFQIEFRRRLEQGVVDISVNRYRVSEMILSDEDEGVNANMKFLDAGDETIAIAATSILKACTLTWADLQFEAQA
ncbi:hypothetical protein [Rhizobium sp. RCAM05973]|uniref:hypothetical protein n=1 Tax=Rhizobium sp. RCAM05973 TaxID=2994066 RepID=UPI0022EC0ED8|nr:hypothetical protein [Rhizobium sp. RCAM05973]